MWPASAAFTAISSVGEQIAMQHTAYTAAYALQLLAWESRCNRTSKVSTLFHAGYDTDLVLHLHSPHPPRIFIAILSPGGRKRTKLIGWPGNRASRRLTSARRTNYLRVEGIPAALQFLAWEGRQVMCQPSQCICTNTSWPRRSNLSVESLA